MGTVYRELADRLSVAQIRLGLGTRWLSEFVMILLRMIGGLREGDAAALASGRRNRIWCAKLRDMPDLASRGWDPDFPDFAVVSRDAILTSLRQLVGDASEEQLRAWRDSIPSLQAEAGEVLAAYAQAKGYGAVLEYVLPLDARRPDCVFLIEVSVLVLELKGKTQPTQADIDQASAYARALRCFHRECAERPVHALLFA